MEERASSDGEIAAHYANDDIFDVRSQFEPHTKHQYIALEDTLSYLLPTDIFLELYHANGQFAATLIATFDTKSATEAAQQQTESAEFILTKVDESIHHPSTDTGTRTNYNQVAPQPLKNKACQSALFGMMMIQKLLDHHVPFRMESSQEPIYCTRWSSTIIRSIPRLAR